MSENKNAKTPADGPVAWGCQCGRAYTVTCISSKPAKQWVGLTDEEHDSIKRNYHNMTWTLEMFARAIEAKLKEKNT
jgi:hypothetical protein